MKMKVIGKNNKKEYNYEYKMIFLKPDVKDLLKEKAKENKKNYSEFLRDLLK